eukprot:3219850-Amphidinium_carterae.1
MHYSWMLIVIPRTDNEEDEIGTPSQLNHPVEPIPSYDEERKDPPNDADGRREHWVSQDIDARSKSRDDSQSDSSTVRLMMKVILKVSNVSTVRVAVTDMESLRGCWRNEFSPN